ncbi:unnamed protein product [Adineta steineri]|uniref:G-protein coupled receptors family 1 profile domain-containing protein n=1 Tax=Adineta steineri TaxID=433720 RepID=A0A819UML3_9BILA|nr:unnamed protein product [Adineta steineri]CAF4096467.1 unnamed protein product [Adineta steineri]
MLIDNSSSSISIQSWFIPLDILTLVCLIFVIILIIIFLVVILIDRTCHTVPMLLVANSCLAHFVLGSDRFVIVVSALYSNIKQIQYHDSFCIFCGYMTYVSCAVLNYSFLLQAFYRYIIVIYPARLFWQRRQSQICLIGLTWLYSFAFPIVFIFTGDIIVYNADNQICQVPLRFSLSIILLTCFIYVIPILITLLIYWRLVHYIHEINQRTTSVYILSRAQRELKMFRRTVILLLIIFIMDFPYALFIFMSFFNQAPKYHFRIAYIFVDIALACEMIILFQFTDQLKTSIMKKLNIRPEIVVPAVA